MKVYKDLKTTAEIVHEKSDLSDVVIHVTLAYWRKRLYSTCAGVSSKLYISMLGVNVLES